MFEGITRGQYKGHPVHAMLVHFPIGLLTAGFCFDIASIWFDPAHLPMVSFYCMAGGIAGGFVAMLFGILDYISLANNEKLFKKAGRHALLQLLSWLLFGTVLAMKFPQYPAIFPPGYAMLIIETTAFLLMMAGNFIGGDLVYKDGVGSKKSV